MGPLVRQATVTYGTYSSAKSDGLAVPVPVPVREEPPHSHVSKTRSWRNADCSDS